MPPAPCSCNASQPAGDGAGDAAGELWPAPLPSLPLPPPLQGLYDALMGCGAEGLLDAMADQVRRLEKGEGAGGEPAGAEGVRGAL